MCRSSATRFLMSVDGKDYWRCSYCKARYLDPGQRLPPDAECRHYLHHQNDSDDAGYRRFLSKLADPLLARLTPASTGLDYGCGCGPALAEMLREAGHRMSLYDPFFFPDPGPLAGTYDFVTCTETAEHFYQPAEEFDKLTGLVSPGGWLAIMTCFQTEDSRFADWHYRRDPTHVVFYREETIRFIATARQLTCIIPAKDVALMQKPRITCTR